MSDLQFSDFHIGFEFYNEAGRWRCTDVGRRVVVAISLEPHGIVSQWRDAEGVLHEKREMTDDPSWHNGPPYAVAEHVFDEYDLETCYSSLEARIEALGE